MDLGEYIIKVPGPYFTEPKIDGKLVFVFHNNDRTFMATRHNGIYHEADYPMTFKELKTNLKDSSCIIHGELVHKTQVLWVHDMLFSSGGDVRSFAYLARKELLDKAIVEGEYIRHVPFKRATSLDDIMKAFDDAIANGFEGIMVKSGLPYGIMPWAKLKRTDTVDVVITKVKESPKYLEDGQERTWHIHVYDQGKEVDIGAASSATKNVDTTLLKPGTVVEVRYQEVFHTGETYRLRHPTIIRIRDDKDPKDCLLDQLQ